MDKLAEKGDEAAPFTAMMKVHKDGLTADYESMRLMTAEVPPKKEEGQSRRAQEHDRPSAGSTQN